MSSSSGSGSGSASSSEGESEDSRAHDFDSEPDDAFTRSRTRRMIDPDTFVPPLPPDLDQFRQDDQGELSMRGMDPDFPLPPPPPTDADLRSDPSLLLQPPAMPISRTVPLNASAPSLTWPNQSSTWTSQNTATAASAAPVPWPTYSVAVERPAAPVLPPSSMATLPTGWAQQQPNLRNTSLQQQANSFPQLPLQQSQLSYPVQTSGSSQAAYRQADQLWPAQQQSSNAQFQPWPIQQPTSLAPSSATTQRPGSMMPLTATGAAMAPTASVGQDGQQLSFVSTPPTAAPAQSVAFPPANEPLQQNAQPPPDMTQPQPTYTTSSTSIDPDTFLPPPPVLPQYQYSTSASIPSLPSQYSTRSFQPPQQPAFDYPPADEKTYAQSNVAPDSAEQQQQTVPVRSDEPSANDDVSPPSSPAKSDASSSSHTGQDDASVDRSSSSRRQAVTSSYARKTSAAARRSATRHGDEEASSSEAEGGSRPSVGPEAMGGSASARRRTSAYDESQSSSPEQSDASSANEDAPISSAAVRNRSTRPSSLAFAASANRTRGRTAQQSDDESSDSSTSAQSLPPVPYASSKAGQQKRPSARSVAARQRAAPVDQQSPDNSPDQSDASSTSSRGHDPGPDAAAGRPRSTDRPSTAAASGLSSNMSRQGPGGPQNASDSEYDSQDDGQGSPENDRARSSAASQPSRQAKVDAYRTIDSPAGSGRSARGRPPQQKQQPDGSDDQESDDSSAPPPSRPFTLTSRSAPSASRNADDQSSDGDNDASDHVPDAGLSAGRSAGRRQAGGGFGESDQAPSSAAASASRYGLSDDDHSDDGQNQPLQSAGSSYQPSTRATNDVQNDYDQQPPTETPTRSSAPRKGAANGASAPANLSDDDMDDAPKPGDTTTAQAHSAAGQVPIQRAGDQDGGNDNSAWSGQANGSASDDGYNENDPENTSSTDRQPATTSAAAVPTDAPGRTKYGPAANNDDGSDAGSDQMQASRSGQPQHGANGASYGGSTSNQRAPGDLSQSYGNSPASPDAGDNFDDGQQSGDPSGGQSYGNTNQGANKSLNGRGGNNDPGYQDDYGSGGQSYDDGGYGGNQAGGNQGFGDQNFSNQGTGDQSWGNDGFGGQGSQGYHNPGLGNQGYNDAGLGNQGYNDAGLGNQGYNDAGLGNQSYNDSGYGNQGLGYGSQGYGNDPYNQSYANDFGNANYNDPYGNSYGGSDPYSQSYGNDYNNPGYGYPYQDGPSYDDRSGARDYQFDPEYERRFDRQYLLDRDDRSAESENSAAAWQDYILKGIELAAHFQRDTVPSKMSLELHNFDRRRWSGERQQRRYEHEAEEHARALARVEREHDIDRLSHDNADIFIALRHVRKAFQERVEHLRKSRHPKDTVTLRALKLGSGHRALFSMEKLPRQGGRKGEQTYLYKDCLVLLRVLRELQDEACERIEATPRILETQPRDVNASLLKQLLAAETNKWQTAIGRDSQKDDEASNKSSESASESVAQNDPYTQDHDSAQAEVLHAAVEAERTFEKANAQEAGHVARAHLEDLDAVHALQAEHHNSPSTQSAKNLSEARTEAQASAVEFERQLDSLVAQHHKSAKRAEDATARMQALEQRKLSLQTDIKSIPRDDDRRHALERQLAQIDAQLEDARSQTERRADDASQLARRQRIGVVHQQEAARRSLELARENLRHAKQRHRSAPTASNVQTLHEAKASVAEAEKAYRESKDMEDQTARASDMRSELEAARVKLAYAKETERKRKQEMDGTHRSDRVGHSNATRALEEATRRRIKAQAEFDHLAALDQHLQAHGSVQRANDHLRQAKHRLASTDPKDQRQIADAMAQHEEAILEHKLASTSLDQAQSRLEAAASQTNVRQQQRVNQLALKDAEAQARHTKAVLEHAEAALHADQEAGRDAVPSRARLKRAKREHAAAQERLSRHMQRDKQLSSAVTFKQARAQRNQLAERVEKLQKKAAHAKAGDRATILAELGEAQFELRAADQAVGHHERAAVERLDLSDHAHVESFGAAAHRNAQKHVARARKGHERAVEKVAAKHAVGQSARSEEIEAEHAEARFEEANRRLAQVQRLGPSEKGSRTSRAAQTTGSNRDLSQRSKTAMDAVVLRGPVAAHSLRKGDRSTRTQSSRFQK